MPKPTGPKKITILYDDREKTPWTQDFFGPGFVLERTRLVTGDYTIEGMEELFVVERKANLAEIYIDWSRRNRQGFTKFLRRFSKVPVRIMVIEDCISNFAKTKSFKYRVDPMVMLNLLTTMVVEYGIQLLPVGSRAGARPFIQTMFRKAFEFNKSGRLFSPGRSWDSLYNGE